jgi:hypothetical protein
MTTLTAEAVISGYVRELAAANSITVNAQPSPPREPGLGDQDLTPAPE